MKKITCNSTNRWEFKHFLSFRVSVVLAVFLMTAPSMSFAMISIVSGNNQQGTANTTLSNPLVVSIDCSHLPIESVSLVSCGGRVNFVSSKPGDRFSQQTNSPSTDIDNNVATASIILTLGSATGSRTITVTHQLDLPGLNPVTFTINGSGVEAQQRTATQQAAGTITTALATVKNGNSIVTNRTSTLHGRDNRGVDVSNVTFNIDQQQLSLKGILEELLPKSGGAAGDDSPLFGERWGVFLNGNFTFGDHDRTERESGYDYDILGTAIGADYRITDNWFLGTSFGYDSTDSDYGRSQGGTEVDTYNISIYTSYNLPGSFFLDGFFRYGWSDFELNRKFTISNTRQQAKANYEGSDYSVGVNGGYEFVYGALSLQPFVRVEYTAVDIDSYRERAESGGAADSILAINEQHLQSLRATVGGQANYAISTRFGVFVPTILVEWQHEFKNNSRTITSNLINDPLAAPVSVITDAPDRNFFNVGAGVSAIFAHGVSGFVFYETLVGNHLFSQHSLTLGVRVAF